MADREILTLKRKTIDPVITTVAKQPIPAETVKLPATKSKKKLSRNRETLGELIKTYPETFSMETPKPLMMGMLQVLFEAMPHLSRMRLRNALGLYCAKGRYLQAVIAQNSRVDLTGQPVSEISAEDKIQAEKKLAILRNKQKDIAKAG
jgi:ProP effector